MTEFRWICLPVRLSGRRVVGTCRIKRESEDVYHLQGEMRVVPAWGRGELQKSCATTMAVGREGSLVPGTESLHRALQSRADHSINSWAVTSGTAANPEESDTSGILYAHTLYPYCPLQRCFRSTFTPSAFLFSTERGVRKLSCLLC